MDLLQMSCTGGILILATIVLRAIFMFRLPKKMLLALWGLSLCRLLLPVTIPSRLSIYSLAGTVFSGAASRVVPATSGSSAAAQPAALPLFLIVWIVGIVLAAGFFTVTHICCRIRYRTALPVETIFLKEWMAQHSLRRKVSLRQSDQITAPVTYGIIRPVILLPKALDLSNEQQLHYILLHELTHIRRFDIVGKYLLAAALCLHWFNPLVWVLYWLANRDMELAADESVIRKTGLQTKSAYAMALVDLEAERTIRFSTFCNHFSKNAIEERIVAIMKLKKASVAGIIAACLVVAGTTTAFATTAINSDTKAESDDVILKEIPDNGEKDTVYVKKAKDGAEVTYEVNTENVKDGTVLVEVDDNGSVQATADDGEDVDIVYYKVEDDDGNINAAEVDAEANIAAEYDAELHPIIEEVKE